MEYLEDGNEQNYVAYSEAEQGALELPPVHTADEFALFAEKVQADYDRARSRFDELHHAYMEGTFTNDMFDAYVAAQAGLRDAGTLLNSVRWVQTDIKRAEVSRLHGWLRLEFPGDDPDFPTA